MAKDADHEWQLQLTALVAEVKANQENMNEKLDEYIESSDRRLNELEDAVYGHNTPGLKEEVRDLKGKWAAFYGIILLVLSAGVNAAMKVLSGGGH